MIRSIVKILSCFLIFALAGCGGGGSGGGEGDIINSAPHADAGTDRSVMVGELVILDGSSSRDPNGDPLTYFWSLQKPQNSLSIISAPGTAQPSFTPDLPGDYVATLEVSDGAQNSTDSIVISAGQADNEAPRAEIVPGNPSAVFIGHTVNLDASSSFDPEGAPLKFLWSLQKPQASRIELDLTDSATISLTPDVVGDYVLTLQVSDSQLTTTASVTITAAASSNNAPNATAGPDTAALVGDLVTLDGANSTDPNGDTLDYSWTLQKPQNSQSSLSDAQTMNPSFTPDVTGDYVLALEVFDGKLKATDSLVVTVSAPANRPPVAYAGSDQTGVLDGTVTLDGRASSDPDGDSLTFSWSLQTPSGSQASLVGATSEMASLSPDVVGTYGLTLTVSDGDLIDSDELVVTITHPPNNAPTANAGPDRTAIVDDIVTMDGSGSQDPDGDPLIYSWTLQKPQGSQATLSNAGTESPDLRPDVAGEYVATLKVDDGRLTASDSATIRVGEPPNQAPVISVEADQSASVGASFTFDGSTSFDPDGNPLNFSWSLQKPEDSQVTLSDPTSASISFTPDVAGEYVGTLTITDGELSETQSVTVNAVIPNRSPIADAGSDQSALVGESLTLDGRGSSDPDGDPLTFSWSLQPPSESQASLAGTTNATAEFTPDIAGEYVATLVVSDGELTDTKSITITADMPNRPPVADAGPDTDAFVNGPVTLNGGASSDPDGDPLSYLWSLQKPAGSQASLDGTTGNTATFTPDISGDYLATLQVSDSEYTVSDSLTITAQVRPNSAPVINSYTVTETSSIGDLIDLAVATSDPDNDPLIHKWSLSQKPEGSNTVIKNAAALVTSFTPDLPGTYLVKLTVSDGAESVAESATIEVTGNVIPTADAGAGGEITTDPAQQPVALDGSGSYDADGSISSFSWQLTAPSDSSATISADDPASPYAEFTADVPGTYLVTLTVTDNSGATAEDTINFNALTFTPPNQAPAADAGPDRLVALGIPVKLNAGDSIDPDENPLTFFWKLESSPLHSSAALASVTTKVTTFTPDSPGEYTLSLIVNDGIEDSIADLVTITAEANLLKIFGDTESDFGVRAIETQDDGFALLCESDSPALVGDSRGTDLLLFKYNAAGIEQWRATYGGPNSDSAWDLKEGGNGDLILTGRRTTETDLENAYLIRVSADGETLLEQDFGGGQWDQAQAVEETAEGDYVFAGFTQSLGDSLFGDAWLVKTDMNGIILDQVRFGEGLLYDDGWGVKPDGTGGYFLVGETQSYGTNGDALLGRVGSDFAAPSGWPKNYGDSGFDQGFDLEVVGDGVVVAGYTEVPPTLQGQAWLFKVDLDGTLQWSTNFGGENLEEARSLSLLDDGGFALAGRSNSPEFTAEEVLESIYLVRTDQDGQPLWQQGYKLPGISTAFSVFESGDGGFLIAGTNADLVGYLPDGSPAYADDEIVLIKTDLAGNLSPILLPGGIAAQEKTEAADFTIDVSTAFADYNGDKLTFAALGLPPHAVIDANTGIISGSLPAVDADRFFRITVIASDGSAADAPGSFSAAGSFSLKVLNVN